VLAFRSYADYTDLVSRLADRLDKDMSTFACHGESECCGANCNFICPYTSPCTHCMMYAEMKRARAIIEKQKEEEQHAEDENRGSTAASGEAQDMDRM